MRFAISPNDPRLVELVAFFDRDEAPAAETWRHVGLALEQVGLRRPSYDVIRRLVRLERRRRELRAEARELIADAASEFAAGRVPNVVWTLERVRELQRREALVTQQYKASGADEEWIEV